MSQTSEITMYYVAASNGDFFSQEPSNRVFGTEEEAQAWAESLYLGPDVDGNEATWEIKPIHEGDQDSWSPYSLRQAYAAFDRHLSANGLGSYAD